MQETVSVIFVFSLQLLKSIFLLKNKRKKKIDQVLVVSFPFTILCGSIKCVKTDLIMIHFHRGQ